MDLDRPRTSTNPLPEIPPFGIATIGGSRLCIRSIWDGECGQNNTGVSKPFTDELRFQF